MLFNMQNTFFQRTDFLLSVASLTQLPIDAGCECAFVGRSNAGKSSALNAITGIQGLAKTSKTPGRTQLLNFFTVNEHARLVDLPGYGYAQVPAAVRDKWQALLQHYFAERRSLTGLVLIMDSRHPLTPYDRQMLDFAQQYQLPVHVLLTKADKLSRQAAQRVLQEVQRALQQSSGSVSIQLFSATKRYGIEEARQQLIKWLVPQEE